MRKRKDGTEEVEQPGGYGEGGDGPQRSREVQANKRLAEKMSAFDTHHEAAMLARHGRADERCRPWAALYRPPRRVYPPWRPAGPGWG